MQGQVSRERERVASVESQIQDLSKTHEDRMDRLEKDLLSIHDSPSEIGSVKKSLGKVNNDITALQKITSQISGMQKNIAELDENIKTTATSSSTDEITDSLSRLKEEVTELDKRLSQKNVSDRASQKNITELSKSLENVQNIQTSLEKTLSKTQSDLQTQITDLLSDEKITKTIQRQIKQNLDERIQETNQALKAEVDKISEMTGEIQDISENISHIKKDLTSLQKSASEMSNLITEKEFGQTVSNISKRIEDTQGRLENLESKATLDRAGVEKEISRLLSNERFVEKAQSSLDKTLHKRTQEMESKLNSMLSEMRSEGALSSKDINTLEGKFKSIESTLEKIPVQEEAIENLRESVTYLKGAKIPVTDKDILRLNTQISRLGTEFTSMKDDLEKNRAILTRSSESTKTLEKHSSSASSTIESMLDRLSTQERDITRLETGLLDHARKQKEVMDEHRKSLDIQIRERIESGSNEAKLSETKRNRGFENLMKRFETHHKRIQADIGEAEIRLRSLSQKEKAIIDNISKQNASVIRQMSSGQDVLKKKLEDTDKFIMHMNNLVTKNKIGLDKIHESNLEKKLTEFRKYMEKQSEQNQKRVDSRVNELERKLSEIMGVVGTWKKKQQSELIDLMKEEG
jgi:chromosome segregation ATPase